MARPKLPEHLKAKTIGITFKQCEIDWLRNLVRESECNSLREMILQLSQYHYYQSKKFN